MIRLDFKLYKGQEKPNQCDESDDLKTPQNTPLSLGIKFYTKQKY